MHTRQFHRSESCFAEVFPSEDRPQFLTYGYYIHILNFVYWHWPLLESNKRGWVFRIEYDCKRPSLVAQW